MSNDTNNNLFMTNNMQLV